MSTPVQGRWAHLNPPRSSPLTDERRGAFGLSLRSFREARRVSQSRLAERADFTPSYVSRLEAGARVPTRAAVERLAVALTLTDDDTARLLSAAGFLPPDTTTLLDDEPEVASVLRLLGDDTVPVSVRDAIRQQMVGLVTIWQATTGSEVSA